MERRRSNAQLLHCLGGGAGRGVSGGGGGIRTHGTRRYTRSPGVPIRPLWHPSAERNRTGNQQAANQQASRFWVPGPWFWFLAEGVGFEPTVRPKTHNGFRDRRLKPLGHPSGLSLAEAGGGLQ